MFETEQKAVEEKILAACARLGLPEPVVDWKWIPFSGQWGISTSFFQLAAAELREKGVGGNVGQRAQEIAGLMAEALDKPVGFDRVEAVKGYLNLYFSTADYARRVVDAVLRDGSEFGKSARIGQRVMVEYSHPNTHKAFHVGHLRGTVLGSSIASILEYAGYEVVRANYLGDIGLHVIKWLWNYLKNHAGEEPGKDLVRWIGEIYVEANRYYENDPVVEGEVRALFSRWDRGDEEIVALWKKTRQLSMDAFNQVYDLLGVKFDTYYFESEEEEPGKKLVEGLIARGLARDERPDGAVIIPLDEILGFKEKYRVLIILRSDGTSLYATKDIPLAIRKFEEFKLDRSIYVVDVRQTLYFQQIFKTLELMGYDWAKECQHLAYEIVNLPGNVTIASREGAVVLLADLVREATRRAVDIVALKNPDLPLEQRESIGHMVALGALKYSMLARENGKIVTFDWDAALNFDGQASPYIQYAAVRAGSILRKAGGGLPGGATPVYELEPAEIEMIDLISRLPKEVQRAAAELRPLYIATLAYDLARAFNNFYNQCPVLTMDEPVRSFRLRLVAATRQAIINTLGLLGIQVPDAM